MLHSIARSEQAQLRAEVKELLSGIWGHLGFNDYASADLSIQAHALGLMADAMMQDNGYMNEVMTKIRKAGERLLKVVRGALGEQVG